MKKSLKDAIVKKGLKVYGDLVMIDGDLYPLPLVQGNDKIGQDVWHASTLPTAETITIEKDGAIYSMRGTCPLTCPGCYGTKGNFARFSDPYFYLMKRTEFLRKYPEIYFYIAKKQIESENIKLIRIHATGDFIPGEAAGWTEIFKDMPVLMGWTYTKCKIAGDIKRLAALKNFNIVRSIIPGCGFNFGHIDYILKVFNKLKAAGKNVYICRCGIDKNQHCSNCAGCAVNDYVLFIEHSTGYNASKDPLYNKIKKIIEKQPRQLLKIK